MDDQACLKLLKACELFKALNDIELRELYSSMVQVKIEPGEVLITQGEITDCMYVLLSGRLLVMGGEGKVIAQIGRGETVGEMGVITNEARSATVAAMRESLLLKLEQSRFNQLWNRHPSVLFEITKIITQRLRKTIKPVRKNNNGSNILVLKGHQQTDIKLFLEQLSASFDHHFRYKILRKIDFPQTLSEEQFDQLIQDLENQYDYLFYEIESISDDWCTLCLGCADRILVLVDGSQKVNYDPEIVSLLSSKAIHHEIKKILVLLHNQSEAPNNTNLWLEPIHFFRHYHLHHNQKEGFARLLRFMNGTAIGLVFGGGGVRSWAQIGAIKYLYEQGIPIDAYAGTSAGAFNLALFQIARDYQDFLEICKINVKKLNFKEYTIPYTSLLSSKSITTLLKEIFNEIKIEDLEKPFICIAGDLFSNKEIELDKGLLWLALRATMSIPGIYPPVYIESKEQLLVDGGVVNNVPIDVMRNYLEGYGKIISIDVSRLAKKISKYDYPLELAWQTILWKKLFSHSNPLNTPSITNISIQGLMLASNQKSISNGALSDIHIALDLADFQLFDKSRTNELIEIGYKSAQKSLANWRVDLGIGSY